MARQPALPLPDFNRLPSPAAPSSDVSPAFKYEVDGHTGGVGQTGNIAAPELQRQPAVTTEDAGQWLNRSAPVDAQQAEFPDESKVADQQVGMFEAVSRGLDQQ